VIVTFEPEEPLSEAKAKFISMSRVVLGIQDCDWASAQGVDVREAAAAKLASRPFKARHTISSNAPRLLRVAWQMELAARLGQQLDDPGLRQATLPTLPVQVYYAVFNAARAMTLTAGRPHDAHSKIHEVFAAEHYRRAFGAWSVRLTGDPEHPAASILDPPICVPISFNPMEIRTDDAEYVWAALRMARRWRLERARVRWLGDKKNRTRKGAPYKNLPGTARAELVNAERCTTLMDFTYELRCRTNYRSIDEYSTEVADEDVRRFHDGLMHLMDVGLLCYEGQIALYAGSNALRQEFDAWATGAQSIGSWATESGRARLDALRSAGL
jgi:hypothetical protein